MQVAKVGFVGCGSHSTNNLYPMLAYARCSLEAVCDLKEDLAQRNARLFGARAWYTDVDRMLNEADLEGVLVVGAPAIHHDIGLKVLSRGLDLFIEKPPAPDLTRAQELVDAAKAHNAFVMTGYMKRHGMAYVKAREMITSGEFEPAVGFFKFGHWPGTNVRGNLLGMYSHTIDLAISFFGDVASVTSHLYASSRAASLAVTLRFHSGKLAQLMLDASQPRIQERVEISGACKGGNALIVVDNVQHMEFHREGLRGTDLGAYLPDTNPRFDLADIQIWRPDYGIPNMGQTRLWFQGYAGEIREFANAILEKREPYPGTEDTLKAMRVIEAIAARPDGTTELA